MTHTFPVKVVAGVPLSIIGKGELYSWEAGQASLCSFLLSHCWEAGDFTSPAFSHVPHTFDIWPRAGKISYYSLSTYLLSSVSLSPFSREEGAGRRQAGRQAGHLVTGDRGPGRRAAGGQARARKLLVLAEGEPICSLPILGNSRERADTWPRSPFSSGASKGR